MKDIYPIIITPPEKKGECFLVYVPDLDINTEGKSIVDSIYMARDAIGLSGICMEDMGQKIPRSENFRPKCENENQIVTLVDIDFEEYRKQLDNKAVRKNCTIPAWLDKKATAQHVNFSAVLQEALKSKLAD